jgi:hypothetical protein
MISDNPMTVIEVGRQRVRQSLGDLDVRHRLAGQPDIRADLLTEEVDGDR